MRLRVFLTLIHLATISTFLSCDPESSTNDFDREQVRIEVHQMLEAYFDAIYESGLRAEFNYLDQSQDFFWVPPGFNSAISYDSVKTILEMNADTFQKVEFHWDTLRVVPVSKDIANYTGIVRGNITDSQDNINTVYMIETGTVIKRDSGWKILSGQSRNLE